MPYIEDRSHSASTPYFCTQPVGQLVSADAKVTELRKTWAHNVHKGTLLGASLKIDAVSALHPKLSWEPFCSCNGVDRKV